jgi:Apea-like HEPN
MRSSKLLINDEITQGLSDQDRTLLDTTKYVLMQEYEATALHDPDPAWFGDTPRSKQDKAEEEINIANIALWIAKPCAIGFRRVVVPCRRSAVWRRVRFGVANPLIPHAFDVHNVVEGTELKTAKELNGALSALGRGDALWVASRTLWLALLTREWTVRYLLLWTALETLFGPTDAREVTYRLSQRLAFFLSAQRDEARDGFEAAKRGYEWRCRVVHGMRLSKLKPETSQSLMQEAESMTRIDNHNRISPLRTIARVSCSLQ